jgi:hypothetical protein
MRMRTTLRQLLTCHVLGSWTELAPQDPLYYDTNETPAFRYNHACTSWSHRMAPAGGSFSSFPYALEVQLVSQSSTLVD